MFLRLYVKAQVWRVAVADRLLEDRGATAVEYALMLALIAMVIMAAVAFLGTSTNDAYSNPDLTNALN
jgi:pilus assembly protein Flp/PilA